MVPDERRHHTHRALAAGAVVSMEAYSNITTTTIDDKKTYPGNGRQLYCGSKADS
jgi:hypothetical protein